MRGREFVTLFSASTHIVLSASSAADSASVGDDVGTVSISGHVTGTPSYSLTNDASGKYSINSSTGLVEVAGALTAGTDTITVSSGLTGVPNKSFSISVSAAAAYALKADFSSAFNEPWGFW